MNNPYIDDLDGNLSASTYVGVNNIINKSFMRLIFFLLLIITFYLVVLGVWGGSYSNVIISANSIGPISIFFVFLLITYHLLKQSSVLLWTPYVLFLMQSAVFFGLGPLVYYFSNDATLSHLSYGNLKVTNNEILVTNLLNSIGITSALFGFYVVFQFMPSLRTYIAPLDRKHFIILSERSPAVFFLLFGGFLKYFIILPYQFGISDMAAPGMITALGSTFDLGLSLAAFMAVRGSNYWRIILLVVLPIHISITLLEFQKTGLMLAIILPALGAYLAHNNLKRLLIWAVIACFIFVLVQPMVHYGRLSIAKHTGSISQATISERIDIIQKFFEYENLFMAFNPDLVQGGWTRLAYSGPQSYAMNLYDNGRPGNTLSQSWIVFIPRILWKDKPFGIAPGKDFHEIVTGHRGSYMGLTVYGDAYWQFGWVGVIILSLVMGCFFAFMTGKTLYWIQTRQFIYLPVILISIKAAVLGPTMYFINGILGVLPIYLAYIIVVKFVLFLMWRTNPRRFILYR